MSMVEFSALPDDARVWVFAASDVLSAQAEARLLEATDAFLDGWRAHGVPLACSRELRESRFLCIAVDQHQAGASGCSIDGLFRTLRALEPQLGTSLVAGGQMYWRNDDGVIARAPRATFAAMAVSGAVRPDTAVFDVTVGTLGEWRRDFERPARASWHARYLPGAGDAERSTNESGHSPA